MFKQLFEAMNEQLDDIIQHYPKAVGADKNELNDKLNVLKAMSDTMIEEWLLFEDKMKILNLEHLQHTAHASSNQVLPQIMGKQLDKQQEWMKSEDFLKGQGYFQLFMFQEAIQYFQIVVRSFPDFIMARLYLALSFLKLGEPNEAYPHFQLIIPMTENNKLKAISYNALGCIQVHYHNTEKACEYFKMAYQTDPTMQEPLSNMEVCLHNCGKLQYGAGLTH